MRKIGLICIALVLALGALGAAYAAWTDTVVINQTVNTGSLEVGIFAVAEKPGDAKNVTTVDVSHAVHKFDKLVDPVPGSALFDAGTYCFWESATIAIGNFYPSFTILEDYVIGVGGTVPVRLHVTKTVVDPDGVYDNMSIGWSIYKISGGVSELLTSGNGVATAQFTAIVDFLEGLQLHGCDVLIIYLDKYLEQTAPQGKDASLTLTVEGIQYNKYDEYYVD